MNQRTLIGAVFGLTIFIGACGKKADPNMTPAPLPSQVAASPLTPVRPVNTDSIARAEAARREAERAVLVNILAETIHFDYDQFVINADDTSRLDRKAAILAANPALRIRVTGHADERGSDEYNLALGMKRALAAKEYLVRLGVDASHIEVASLGREVPLDPSPTEAAYAKNRRDEFEAIAGAQVLIAPR